MTTVTVCLPPDLEQFAADQVKRQGHGDVSDYLVELVRRASNHAERAALEEKLLEGIRSLKRGEGIPVTQSFWDGLHAELRERRAKGDSA